MPTTYDPYKTNQTKDTSPINKTNDWKNGYTDNQINTWQNSAEYKSIADKFLEAHRTGNVAQYDVLQNEATNAMNKMFSTVPQFDPNKYITDVTTAGNSAIDSANASRIAMINARLQEQLGYTDGQIRDVNNNYDKSKEQIQGNVYDAQETQRASGVQRGIQYSQQQQALEQGVSRAGMKMVVDAGKDRDSAILNIKDRIASLKSGASYEMQASTDQANADKANLLAQATAQANQREWNIQDTKANQNYNDTTITNQQNYQDQVRYEGWTREDAVADKAYNNQINLMNIDQQNKIQLQNLDFNQKKEFLKLETGQQKELLAIKQKYDIDIFNLNSAQQIKLQGMQASSQMALAKFDAQTQKELLASKNASDDARFQVEMEAKANEQLSEMWKSYVMNDPSFNMYPNKNDSREINDKQIRLLTSYFDANGVPQAMQNELLKGRVTPNYIIDMSAKNSNKTSTTIKKEIENILKFK